MKNKKSQTILIENIIFILFTVIFIVVMFNFISDKSSTTSRLEQAEAKKLAMIINSAKPGTNIQMNIQDLLNEKEGTFELSKVVIITDNVVTVKLSPKSSYSYNFFNDVEVISNIAIDEEGSFLFLTIKEKQKEI